MSTDRKSYAVTYFLCFLFGPLGVHRFYMGKILTGVLQLVTIGGLGIWWLIDLIIIGCGFMRDKNGLPLERFGKHGEKKQWVTYVLSMFAILGLHRFYLGRYKTGILMLITIGGLGIWATVDHLLVGAGILTDKNGNLTKL